MGAHAWGISIQGSANGGPGGQWVAKWAVGGQAKATDYSIPNRNLHSAEDPSTFLVVLSFAWSTRRCRGLRPAGIVESAPGDPEHPEGPLSRLLRSSRRPEVEDQAGREERLRTGRAPQRRGRTSGALI